MQTGSRAAALPVRQITTAAECRLDAEMVTKALDDLGGGPFDALFIENVGNLICPAEYDLGEDLRIVLIAVTEGEDKPLKYPLAFNSAHVAVVTKIDIAEAVGYDRETARRSIAAGASRHPDPRDLGSQRRRDGRVVLAARRTHPSKSRARRLAHDSLPGLEERIFATRKGVRL